MDCPEADGHNKLLFSDLGKQDACKLCEISFLLAPALTHQGEPLC